MKTTDNKHTNLIKQKRIEQERINKYAIKPTNQHHNNPIIANNTSNTNPSSSQSPESQSDLSKSTTPTTPQQNQPLQHNQNKIHPIKPSHPHNNSKQSSHRNYKKKVNKKRTYQLPSLSENDQSNNGLLIPITTAIKSSINQESNSDMDEATDEIESP
eukprot:71906_1